MKTISTELQLSSLLKTIYLHHLCYLPFQSLQVYLEFRKLKIYLSLLFTMAIFAAFLPNSTVPDMDIRRTLQYYTRVTIMYTFDIINYSQVTINNQVSTINSLLTLFYNFFT